MSSALVFARAGQLDIALLSQFANRHGLIAGATGTGKTVTLQKLAESFANEGVPVFMADVKGDLSGLGALGEPTAKLQSRLTSLGIGDWQAQKFDIALWDVFATQGHPLRATISDMGPLLLARLLNLNEVQTGVLNIIFKVADNNGLLLLDLKDLKAMVQYVAEHARELTTEYGNVSSASLGAIQRGLLVLEEQGGDKFFGEPMLNIMDLMQTDAKGNGIINILAADQLYSSPKLYAAFLLWLLAELFEHLPEAGDLEKPKLVFFFDEAHLLFNDAPAALLEKIEQVVRLIRSKGVGIYFVTQNPLDIPDAILGQLGNRIQHALRAFTPRDQKAVKSAAETMRANPALNTGNAILELGVGEALVSCLDAKGTPCMVERAMILPPSSRIGPLRKEERDSAIKASLVYGVYEELSDRESAYEKLKQIKTTPSEPNPTSPKAAEASDENAGNLINDILFGSTGPRGGKRDGLAQLAAKTLVRTVSSGVGREILRGVLGSILGGRRR
ncbi:MAG TPA: helicase HerA-like domain-containing protein [Cellvibrio sp.]|nr:helicase HerA-like domain-containing protein [Cellvibrio sp.]